MKKIIAFFISLVVSVPLALVAIAIADSELTPEWLRCVLSPGYVLGLRFATGGFREGLQRFMDIAISVNMLFYGTIAYMLLRKFSRKLDLPRSKQFWMQD